MSLFKVSCVLILAAASHGVQLPPRKPGGLGGTLGSILPTMNGWGSGSGWISSTTTPPPTTGWPSTPPPTEAPTGWPSTAPPTPPPTTGWPSTSPPATGWPSTAPPPNGWPAPSGWSNSAPGWSGPVSLELLSESEVFGEGEAAATHGSDTVVQGDSSNPAIASIQSGSSVGLGQGAGNVQMTSINQHGESQTINAIDNYNYGDATEYMGAALSGNNISNINGGASLVSGLGALGQLGLTLNNGAPSGSGWSSGKK